MDRIVDQGEVILSTPGKLVAYPESILYQMPMDAALDSGAIPARLTDEPD